MNPHFESKMQPVPGGPEPDIDGDIISEDWEQAENGVEEPPDDDQLTESPRQPFHPWLRGIIALLVLLGFLFLSFSDGLRLLTSPSLDFLAQSRELIQDPYVRELQKPVVFIRSYGLGFDQGIRQGTGFNIHENGLVVTNRHLVEGASFLSVHFRDHGVFYATEWFMHPYADLAVIQLEGENLPTASLLTGGLPRVGSQVLVIGNPLGFVRTVTQGTIQSYGRIVGYNDGVVPVMVVDATVHSGSSGSPVFDRQGRVVGIIFAQIPAQASEPIRGLAVPVSTLLQLLVERG